MAGYNFCIDEIVRHVSYDLTWMLYACRTFYVLSIVFGNRMTIVIRYCDWWRDTITQYNWMKYVYFIQVI